MAALCPTSEYPTEDFISLIQRVFLFYLKFSLTFLRCIFFLEFFIENLQLLSSNFHSLIHYFKNQKYLFLFHLIYILRIFTVPTTRSLRFI